MDVLFIQTGGTIDKDYPKNINGWGFEIGQPASEKLLSSLLSLNHRTITAFQKDSTKIDHDDLKTLKTFVKKLKRLKSLSHMEQILFLKLQNIYPLSQRKQ